MAAKLPRGAWVVVVFLMAPGLRVGAATMDRPEGAVPGQPQPRPIPPFSPSLELARSMGSSPVTPQGRDPPALESPRAAVTKTSTTPMEDALEDAAVASGDSEGQDVYERGAVYDRSQDLVEEHVEEAPLGDLPLGEEEEQDVCPPRLPHDYITWRRNNRVVRATLPHQVFSSCTPPLRCSVTTTVHRRVFLQDGDTLEVLLQTPPDYTPPSSPQPPPTSTASTTTTTTTTAAPPHPSSSSPSNASLTTPTTTTTTDSTSAAASTPTTTTAAPASGSAGTFATTTTRQEMTSKTSAKSTEPSLSPPLTLPTSRAPHSPPHTPPAHHHLNIPNNTHIFSRVDHPAHPSAPSRRKRQAQGVRFPQPPILTLEESRGSLDSTKYPMNGAQGLLSTPPQTDTANQSSTSPLTIWKASVSEWASCSTREGSQVGESGPEGVVTISPRLLQVGSNYFIGRSSWSSTECFKLQVTVRSAECGEGSLCSGKGSCYTKTDMEHFQCKCCDGYIGSHCEEMDACNGDPCLNAGICVDIQEGHDGDTFQCLCPYGFRGRFCEERTNLCESGPCRNGATCTGNHSSYTCHCPSGWTGPQCTVRSRPPVDESRKAMGCAAGPCEHGVCVETSGQNVRCFCQPGFGGQRCEFEYNECDSSPCVNGGTCVDHIGGYECLCGRGYTGTRCEIKFDLCEPNPCAANLICVDKGNSHSCECLRGFTEDNCGPHPQLCTPNPCDNGGTCWNLPDANVFYCACRAGFTGTTCQDEAVPETVGVVGTMETAPLEVHLPMDMPFDHMKNIYVAIATLAAALLIFIVVVGVCHCRVNRTYKKFLVKLPRPHKVMPTVKRPRPTSLFEKPRFVRNWYDKRGDRAGSLRLEAENDGASMPMTASNSSSDAVYYNMDVCDNQELPLIK
ncbi:delta and Notch-like epidermal growth factor-related receptor isoform X3 [Eriocheir sinensis]|uniref:delta and Notch-like epidermal growth factor-related receptor isoform X3 n=1 Tax=Eriocheir sinensis TaxID=95602 RepID=UPI0021C66ABA|nr:delta and Notch-like epidermal growth factor-related receptor isoform X3 [Eriocheir sinensis]